ncbi:hypothetical protein EWM64_g3320 [Hericium alpestre]|uniref:Transmembrane protein n=1 Tax=Hericium alpestre TaxID=135208 RepID=A0A4Z0A2Z8_9AGAM|nr:hypothetical protein EWM64_g3320 [Hericium alpestre]
MQIIQLWSDRLQLISVFATFFTSVDGLLLNLTTPVRTKDVTGKVANAALSGALVFHSAAAILAFVGCFILIRYRFNDAKQKDPLPLSPVHAQFRSKPNPHTANHARDASDAETATMLSRTSSEKQKNPDTFRSFSFASAPLPAPTLPRSMTHLEREFAMLLHSVTDSVAVSRVHPLRFRWFKAKGADADEGDTLAHAESLTQLLTRCHNTCAAFTSLGFMLNILGFVAFAWTALDRGVSIFVSACVASSVIVGLMAVC